MKRLAAILFTFCFLLFTVASTAQCSICSRTAEQMGEKSARGLNTGIIYLMAVPFVVVGLIFFRWWRQNKV